MPSPTPRTRSLREVLLRLVVALGALTLLQPIFVGDVDHFWRVGQHLSWSNLPYRGLFWEFPPATLGWLLPGAVLPFAAYRGLFVVSMIACEYGSLRLLRRTWPELDPVLTRTWTLVVLPLATVTYFRLDFVPVLAATGALVAIHRGRSGTGWLVFGAAGKLWPALLAATHLVERRWASLRANVLGVLVLLVTWWAWSPAGMGDWLAYRRGSGLQLESVAASIARPFATDEVAVVSGAFVVGPGGWGWVETATSLLMVVIVATLVWQAFRRGAEPVALAGALVAVVICSSRILSPQYLVWLAPMVALLAARGHRRPAVLFGVAGVLTVLVLQGYLRLIYGEPLLQAMLVVRNGLLLWLTVELIRLIRPTNVRSDGLSRAGRLSSWPTSSSSAEPVSTT